MSMNTGFSWVRIDKGTIQCTFRYLSIDQVTTVIDYLKSYSEYHNVIAEYIDLGSLIGSEHDHATPYPYTIPEEGESYYWLVNLHRHGTIIPQGCIEIIKTGINLVSLHAMIPYSVFIQKFSTNVLTVGDERILQLISAKTPEAGVVPADSIDWSLEPVGSSVLTLVPDGMTCDLTAAEPGSATVVAKITVMESQAKEYKTMPIASALYISSDPANPFVVKYIGPAVSYMQYHHKFEPIGSTSSGVRVDFIPDHYFKVVTNPAEDYVWEDCTATYDGSPVPVPYADTYTLLVKTYIHILNKDEQRLCLYHANDYHAESPSVDLVPEWSTVDNIVDFIDAPTEDPPITGNHGYDVRLYPNRVGTTTITTKITDEYGVYTDSFPLTVYAMAVAPKTLVLVPSQQKRIYIKKGEIFLEEDPDTHEAIPVSWTSGNVSVADVAAVDPAEMADPTTNYVEALVTGLTAGNTYVAALAENPADGYSYGDTVSVKVGTVAIDAPEDAVIYLLSGTTTLEITAAVATGWEIASDGWVSGNTAVATVGTPSQTTVPNDTVVITGLTEGTALITLTAKLSTDASKTNTDQLLVRVVDADYVTAAEMYTFTRGLYDGHGVVDWDPEHPTEMNIEEGIVDTATQEEVDEFVGDLFGVEPESTEETSEEPEETPEEPAEEPTEEPVEETPEEPSEETEEPGSDEEDGE